MQLRNIGFRASRIPTRRISPLFGATPIGTESFTRTTNRENSPHNTEKRSAYGENLPSAPVNILQEIHNSAGRKTGSPRRGFGGIFQDSTSQAAAEDKSEASWYRESSNNCSPAAASPGSTMFKLREVSGNQRIPPMSSPLVKHVNDRRVSRPKLRSTSFETTQHIEYLERELASANAKNDSDSSPATKKRRSAKMRTLAVENNNLRQELAEWQRKYDMRVDDEVQKRLEFEADMKERLDALESESEMKDARIGELEWELECVKIKARGAEGLEEVNKDLEKRIDVLTNLLVPSPTWMDVRSAATSPSKQDPTKRTPRPRSMLSKAPSSPEGARLSLATVSETAFGDPQNFGLASRGSQVVDEGEQLFASPEHGLSPRCEEALPLPDGIELSTQNGFFGSRSQTSISARSLPSSFSRPASFMSGSSFGGAPWGIPVLPECESEANGPPKRRRMRRFASGSKSLKPLVLPTATNLPSLPISAPVYPSIESTVERNFSDVSLDPTTSFLSGLASSSPVPTPTQPPRRPSITGTHDQALKALEGKYQDRAVSQSGYDNALPTSNGSEPILGCTEDTLASNFRRRSRPRSLQKELEEAEIAQAGLGISAQTCEETFEDGLIPISRDATPESGQILIGLEALSSDCSTQNTSQQQRLKRQYSKGTTKPPANLVPSASIANIPSKSSPSTAVTPGHAHGIFNRLTNLICQTKQDPLNLATRLLTNAWCLNANRLLGGVGWWLLGLVYHRRKRKPDQCADMAVVEEHKIEHTRERQPLLQIGDEEKAHGVEFNWPHFSAEASRCRAAERHQRNYGGTWLTPPHVHYNSHALPPFLPSAKAHKTPHLFPCNDCVEPSSRRTLRLWFHFSLTIVLAVGMALKHGPAALLVDMPVNQTATAGRTEGPLDERRQERDISAQRCADKGHHTGMRTRTRSGTRDVSERTSKTENNFPDSAYGSLVFAEMLGPVDFEDDGRE